MKIVFAPRIAPAAEEIGQRLLPRGFDFEYLAEPNEPERRIAQLRSADFLMGFYSGRRLSPEDYDHIGAVKLIQLLSAGYDGMNLGMLRELGVPLASNGGANSYAVAEHAIMLMMAVYRNLPGLDAALRRGEWSRGRLGEEEAHELAGRTVGVIGAGNIGTLVARRLAGFEVELIYTDPVRLTPEMAATLKMTYVEPDDLFRRADVVTLHAPGNPSTHHMINARTLALMKPDAILINCARGELVDEEALYDALKERRIAGAGLDTFDPEPPLPGNPLLTLPNVVLSPHAAGPTWESWPKRFGNSYANIERVARGEPPLWVVPELL
ncbi:MAG: 2-hydroxyacid dehydrogenase [Dehalococcoidia bacterium]